MSIFRGIILIYLVLVVLLDSAMLVINIKESISPVERQAKVAFSIVFRIAIICCLTFNL